MIGLTNENFMILTNQKICYKASSVPRVKTDTSVEDLGYFFRTGRECKSRIE